MPNYTKKEHGHGTTNQRRSRYVVCTAVGRGGWAWESKWSVCCRQCGKPFADSHSHGQQHPHNGSVPGTEVPDVQLILTKFVTALGIDLDSDKIAEAAAVAVAPPKPEGPQADTEDFKKAKERARAAHQRYLKQQAVAHKHRQRVAQLQQQLADEQLQLKKAEEQLEPARLEDIEAAKELEATVAKQQASHTAAGEEGDAAMRTEDKDDGEVAQLRRELAEAREQHHALERKLDELRQRKSRSRSRPRNEHRAGAADVRTAKAKVDAQAKHAAEEAMASDQKQPGGVPPAAPSG